MVQPAALPFLGHFTALQDPRQTAKVLYPLPELLLLLGRKARPCKTAR